MKSLKGSVAAPITTPASDERPQGIADRPEVAAASARERAADRRVQTFEVRLKETADAKAAILGSLQEIEERGEDPGQSLARVEATEAAERRMLTVAIDERARARADLDRAIEAARRAAAPEWIRYLEALLAEQESHLWRVLELNLAIGWGIGAAFADGIPLATRGPSGFPGWPLITRPEAIFTWIRNRAVAPGRALSPIPDFAKEGEK